MGGSARLLLLLPTRTYRTEDFVDAAHTLGVDLACASEKPSTLEAFLRLNVDLTPAVAENTQRESQLASFTAPVLTAFGELDPYLSPAQGRALAGLFPNSGAVTVAGVGHFPQLDAPAEVAKLILTVPTAGM